MCYGVCETMNGNWSQLDMTTRPGASASTQASLALAASWAMVTVGRVLFGAPDRWLPERVSCHILPFVPVGTFLGVAVLTRPHAAAGIAAFGFGSLQHGGTSLSAIFGFTAIVAGVMALLSFFVSRRRPAPAELAAAGPGSSRPAETVRPLRSESP